MEIQSNSFLQPNRQVLLTIPSVGLTYQSIENTIPKGYRTQRQITSLQINHLLAISVTINWISQTN